LCVEEKKVRVKKKKTPRFRITKQHILQYADK